MAQAWNRAQTLRAAQDRLTWLVTVGKLDEGDVKSLREYVAHLAGPAAETQVRLERQGVIREVACPVCGSWSHEYHGVADDDRAEGSAFGAYEREQEARAFMADPY